MSTGIYMMLRMVQQSILIRSLILRAICKLNTTKKPIGPIIRIIL